MHVPPAERPTRRQYVAARAITQWYLDLHHGRRDDPGTTGMFTDPEQVGHFAVDPEALAAGDGRALFKLLVTCTMFQRRQDQQILRVLRGISAADAAELTDADRLRALAADTLCPYLESTTSLHHGCDLAKRPGAPLGVCGQRPEVPCALKRHTVLLKRYGHFGKVPTSAALMVREAGARDLEDLYEQLRAAPMSAAERSLALEAKLRRAWRVSDKITAMFVSALCNADLSQGAAPWRDGLDWSYFVVIDSNVDLFLAATGYQGRGTYAARRGFVQRLAKRIDLAAMRPGLRKYNPRLVQQALYLFMSETNRRRLPGDCSATAPKACSVCSPSLLRLCSLGP